jgi:hypothetical protein
MIKMMSCWMITAHESGSSPVGEATAVTAVVVVGEVVADDAAGAC